MSLHRIIICGDCGRGKPHKALGLCKACYMSARRSAAFLVTDHVVEGITHGRYGYEERGCRCEICVAARRAGWRRDMAARQGRAGAS